MKNEKSTNAMKLAHIIAKTNSGMTFGQALKAAWKIVKSAPYAVSDIMAPAKRIVVKWYQGTRTVTPNGYITISVWKSGIVNKVKRWFNDCYDFEADINVRVIL